jgi:hypothetical protein
MAIKTLRVFQEFTSAGYVPMPVAGNIDYGVTIAGTFPGTTPTTFQTDDPDIDVTLTATTDYYVWIRSHGTDWNPMYTRNVRVYPDSPLVNNVVMGIIIANLDNTVPYTSATENVNLGEFGLTAGYLGLDLTPTATPTLAGTMSWNDADGTANLILKGGNVTLQVGQEQVTRIVNKTGANLLEANYQAVRVSGAQGNRLKVDLAQANIDANSAETLGLVTETINNNQEGFITTSGLVRNIDTTGTLQGETWADGDMLYLSGTTAGRITNIKPQAPTHTVIMGYVVRAHQTQGQIYVKVDNGYELDELHNVKITSVANKNTLVYDSATSVWKNRNIFGTQGYVPYYDDTLLMKNSPIFTDGTQVIIGDDEEFSVGNKLSVVGNIAVHKDYGYHSGLYQILFRQDATGEFRIGTNAANDYTTFYANGTERVRISPSGFLGVGLTNPTSILHVKGTTAYTNAIIDNNSASGGGYYSAYQNGAEKAIFGVSGAWLLDNSSDAALIAKGVGQGIQFYTNGSTSEKMGINSDGNVFVGQTPTYVAGATQLVVRGKTGAGFVGVNHYDMSIKGGMNTFNYVFQVGTSTFHSMAFLVEDIERGRVNSSGRLLWGTTTDNTTDLVQINGSLIATSIKKSGGTSSQFLKADGSVDSTTYGTGTVTSVAMSVPTGLSINGSPITTSGTLALSLSAGYSIPTTSSQGTWDTAYNRSLTSIGVSGTTTKTLTLTKQDGTTLTASWSDINTDAVTSVFGRTGAIVATGGDYTTAQVTESGNLYYLDSRARASISGGTGISYNSTTGVITNTITQYTDALARASISGGTGISYNSTSGVITNTITQYTDALARASLSFVAGSGAYNSTTGVITIPTNTSQLTNGAGYITGITSLMVTNALGYTPVTNARQLTINGTTYDLSADRSWTISGTIGGLTSGYIPKATSASTLGNSLIYDNGSNIHIGGTAAPSKLTVSGDIESMYTTSAPTVNYLKLGTYGNGAWGSYIGASSNYASTLDTDLRFGVSTGGTLTEAMRIFSNQNISIGSTTNAGYKLDVSGTGRFSSYVNVNGASTLEALNVNGNIWLAGTANRYIRLQSATNYYYNLQSFNDDFRIVEAGSIPRLVITYPNGNVGIGTISPGNKLSVVGATNIRDFLLIDNSQSYFGDNGSVSTGTADGNTLIQYYTTKYLTFKQSGFERMRLDASGNLGLGVTPSAWGGGSVGLDIGGDPFSGINGSLRLALTTNAYAIGATYYYRLSGLSSQQYRLSVGTNNHEWYNAPSGTAGGVISYTQAMTLTSGGNLLVGTTTDNGSRLQVQGNVRFNYSDNFGYFGIGYISAANYGFYNYNYGRADLLFTQATGAATFSSTVTAGGRYIVSVSSSAGISDISYGSYSGGAFINTPSATIGYLAAAGTLALAWDSSNVIFYTNSGNERMRIVQSGNVGIGTTSPLALLNVVASGTKSTIAIGNTAASTYSQVLMYGGSGKYNWSLGAQYNVNNGFEITPSTAVDGTTFTTPVFQITNSGAATFSSSVTAGGNITSGGGAYDAGGFFLPYSTASASSRNWKITNDQINFGDFSIKQSSTQSGLPDTVRFYISNAGNVGIGTTSPARPLDVNGTMRIADGSSIEWGGVSAAISGTSASNALLFYTSSSERMRITSGGNVLIGTTTDSGFKLDVNAGNLRVKGSTNEQLVLDYTTASGGFTWQSFRINGTNKYRIFGHTDNSFALYSDTASAQVLTFASTGAATFSSSVTATSFIKTGGTSSQYLMADGSVTTSSGSVGGSGTTNYISKWNGTTSLANSQIFDNGTQVTVGSNVAMYKFAVNPVSNSYFGIGYTGTNSIFVNAVDSGFTSIPIVNNALSHTWLIGFGTAMTLTSSLDLLIGTSTGVSGGGKLQVNGDVNINGNFKINGTVIGGGGGSGITGSGTTNMIAKWTGGTSLGDSALYDNGAYSMGIGTTSIAFPTDRKGLVIRPNGANSGEILLQNSGNTNGSTDGFAIANINGDGVALYNRINAHIRFGTNNTERLRITEDGNLGFGTTSQFGGGVKVIGISNCTSIPNTTPSGGGILFVQNGALKYMGSNGTYTTIANA